MVCRVVEFFEIDTHGKSSNFHEAIVYGDLPYVVRIAKNTLNASDEVFPVIMRVEPNKVRAKQSFENPPAPFPGKQSKNLKLRERNMEEKADPDFWQAFSEEMRQEHQVIIVNPYRVVRADRV
jgi:hypothetical protein